MIPHIVYLANTSSLKVGITRQSQVPTRWMDQGASQALPIFRVKTRRISGFVEVALAQSMAREFSPQGIHVSHVVIDGAIDTEWIEKMFPQRYATKAHDGILNPDDIAEVYWQIHRQPRSAWTHEMDLRPWLEKF